jgi:cytidine deaminase
MFLAYGIPAEGITRYGAAVLAEDGNIYSGGQYKAETRQISLHAEQVALVHAAAHGQSHIRAVAVVSDEDPSGDAFTNPCGICKQALYESALYSGKPMLFIFANLQGRYVLKKLDELIVYPWP